MTTCLYLLILDGNDVGILYNHSCYKFLHKITPKLCCNIASIELTFFESSVEKRCLTTSSAPDYSARRSAFYSRDPKLSKVTCLDLREIHVFPFLMSRRLGRTRQSISSAPARGRGARRGASPRRPHPQRFVPRLELAVSGSVPEVFPPLRDRRAHHGRKSVNYLLNI